LNKLPLPLRNLVDQLANFPGVGPKSALRMAMTMLKWPREKTRNLGQGILDLRDRLCICSGCASLADNDPCDICSDPARDDEKLCVVSEWDSLLIMEESSFFRGKYLVLGGLLSPLDGVDPGLLEFDKLRKILGSGKVKELILALGTTLESETTNSYIKNMLAREFPGLILTRLAQGIPLGSDLKFMDKETLRQSMLYRQSI